MVDNKNEEVVRKRRPRIGETRAQTQMAYSSEDRQRRSFDGYRRPDDNRVSSYKTQRYCDYNGRQGEASPRIRSNVYENRTQKLTAETYQAKLKILPSETRDELVEKAHTRLTMVIGQIDEDIKNGRTIPSPELKSYLHRTSLDEFPGVGHKSLLEMRKMLADVRSKMDMEFIDVCCRNDHHFRAADYLNHTDSKTLSDIIMEMGKEFKRNPSDKKAQEYNQLLGSLNKKIVKIERIDTPINEARVARAEFDGFLHVPEERETGKYFTKAFSDFRAGKITHSTKPVNVEDLPIIKAITSENTLLKLAPLVPIFRDAVKNQCIPASVLKEANLADFTDIVYMHKYGKRPRAGSNINIDQLADTEEGVSVEFWNDLRKDRTKMRQLRSNIHDGLIEKGRAKGIKPEQVEKAMEEAAKSQDELWSLLNLKINGEQVVKGSLHHEKYVQDCQAFGGSKGINKKSGYAVALDLYGEPTHDCQHAFDASKGRYEYRMIDSNDDGRSHTWLIVDMKTTVKEEVAPDKNKLSYRKLAVEMER